MKKPKYYHFHNDTFRQDFYFLPKWDRYYLMNDFGVDAKDAAGVCFTRPGGILIWIEDCTLQNLGFLVHECVHAAMMTYMARGVVVSAGNDEAVAYLSEWIFERCLPAMKIKPK